MIFIERDRLDERGVPIRPSAKWFTAAKVKTGEAVTEGKSHEVQDLYRDPEVKAALEKLFHYKCAYCERPLGEDWDVEHFRPKKAVAESPGHPGYYWLVYTWDNLYPACRYCNQLRRDARLWDEPSTLPAAGKLDQFPLEDESARAMSHEENLAAEAPLLLDPCRKTDAFDGRFLFDVQGRIRPADANDRHAQATIQICHLKRRRLRNERALAILKAAKVMALLQVAREEKSFQVEVMLQGLLADLIADATPFAAAARNVARDPAAFAALA